jgi:hypothetical protein
MEHLLAEIEKIHVTGPSIAQFIDRLKRTTQLYLSRELPREAWRHLMIQSLIVGVTDFTSEEQITKLELNALIDRMLKFDQQPL